MKQNSPQNKVMRLLKYACLCLSATLISNTHATDTLPIVLSSATVEKLVTKVDGGYDPQFGKSAVISGDRLAVSAPMRLSSEPGVNPHALSFGAVYIFERNSDGQWEETAQIDRDAFGSLNKTWYFGASLVLQGDRLLIGSPSSNVNGNQRFVYIYDYSEEMGWELTGTLASDEGLETPKFGKNMLVVGDTIFVSSETEKLDPDDYVTPRGAVYVFSNDNDTGQWMKTGKLDKSAFAGDTDQFGGALALIDDTLFVSAPSANDIDGRLFAYVRSEEGQWLPQQELFTSSTEDNYRFGELMTAGDGVLITTRSSDYGTNRLVAFEKLDGQWVQTSFPDLDVGHGLNNAIVRNGRVMMVGGTGSSLGLQAFYLNNAGAWEPFARFDVPDNINTYFGNLTDDKQFVVSSSNTGKAYIFDVDVSDFDTDGEIDFLDNCPELENADQADNDRDESGDACDLDDDNDGTPDNGDAFPFDSSENMDTDGDGTGDVADNDDDGDGTPDSEDAFPLDAIEQFDTDLDGIGNNADTDDDDDGVPDSDDLFPLNAFEQTDNDRDGIGDRADTDDDNDGTPDDEDAFPFDSLEQFDTDGDGLGNITDWDDDNDGQIDADEFACGSDALDAASMSPDSDGDGVPDCFNPIAKGVVSQLSGAAENLQSIAIGASGTTARTLNRAVTSLNTALRERNWSDNEPVTRRSRVVFANIRNTVRDIERLANAPDVDLDTQAQLNEISLALVENTRALAESKIADAKAANGTRWMIGWFAEPAFARAVQAQDADQLSQAARDFGSAFRWADAAF